MATAGQINAGRAQVFMGADDRDLMQKLRNAGARIKQFGQSIMAVGQQLIGVGQQMLMPFQRAVNEFKNFERWMARVGVITEVGGDQLRMLSDEALRIGRETIFMAQNSAKAMSVFAQAGFTAQEIFDSAQANADLAAAAMYQIEDAALIAARVMRSMQLDTKQARRWFDVLAHTVVSTTAELNDLGNALKYVGPLAKRAGMGFETLTANVAALAEMGVVGSMGGTAMRSIILSMSSEKGSKLLKGIGVDVADAN